MEMGLGMGLIRAIGKVLQGFLAPLDLLNLVKWIANERTMMSGQPKPHLYEDPAFPQSRATHKVEE